jgi:hypothetical protein
VTFSQGDRTVVALSYDSAFIAYITSYHPFIGGENEGQQTRINPDYSAHICTIVLI